MAQVGSIPGWEMLSGLPGTRPIYALATWKWVLYLVGRCSQVYQAIGQYMLWQHGFNFVYLDDFFVMPETCFHRMLYIYNSEYVIYTYIYNSEYSYFIIYIYI